MPIGNIIPKFKTKKLYKKAVTICVTAFLLFINLIFNRLLTEELL